MRFPTSCGRLLGSSVIVVVTVGFSSCLAARLYLDIRVVLCVGLAAWRLVTVVILLGAVVVFLGNSSGGVSVVLIGFRCIMVDAGKCMLVLEGSSSGGIRCVILSEVVGVMMLLHFGLVDSIFARCACM